MYRDWLKAKRLSKNIEVVDIMKSVDISRQYYNMLEAGTRNPSVNVAQKIAGILEFDWTLFFCTAESDTKTIKITESVVKGCKSESINEKQ